MSYIIKALLISLVAGAQVATTNSVTQQQTSKSVYESKTILGELKKDQTLSKIDAQGLGRLSELLATDFSTRKFRQNEIENLISKSGLKFSQVQQGLTSIAQRLALPSSSFQVISGAHQTVKVTPVTIYSKSEKVTELIQKSTFNKVLKQDQVSLFADFFASQIKTKTLDYNQIIGFCQQKQIEISTIDTALLTFLREINQVIPEVKVNLSGYYKYQVHQSNVVSVVQQVKPKILAKPDISETDLLEAFSLYLEAKARAEAIRKEDERLKINLRAIVNFLKIQEEQRFLEDLINQFLLLEQSVVQVVPQIVVSRSIYIQDVTVVNYYQYSRSEIEIQRQYENKINSISIASGLSYAQYSLQINQINSQFSSCNYCLSIAEQKKREYRNLYEAKLSPAVIVQETRKSTEITTIVTKQVTETVKEVETQGAKITTSDSESDSETEQGKGRSKRETKDESSTESKDGDKKVKPTTLVDIEHENKVITDNKNFTKVDINNSTLPSTGVAINNSTISLNGIDSKPINATDTATDSGNKVDITDPISTDGDVKGDDKSGSRKKRSTESFPEDSTDKVDHENKNLNGTQIDESKNLNGTQIVEDKKFNGTQIIDVAKPEAKETNVIDVTPNVGNTTAETKVDNTTAPATGTTENTAAPVTETTDSTTSVPEGSGGRKKRSADFNEVVAPIPEEQTGFTHNETKPETEQPQTNTTLPAGDEVKARTDQTQTNSTTPTVVAQDKNQVQLPVEETQKTGEDATPTVSKEPTPAQKSETQSSPAAVEASSTETQDKPVETAEKKSEVAPEQTAENPTDSTQDQTSAVPKTPTQIVEPPQLNNSTQATNSTNNATTPAALATDSNSVPLPQSDSTGNSA